MEQVITDIKRRKLAEATHTTGRIPKVKYIAVGSGGVDASGKVITPRQESTTLGAELLRREYTSSRKVSENCYEYSLLIESMELVGEYISEIALIDEDGDIVAIATFLPKGKDTMEDTFAIRDLY